MTTVEPNKAHTGYLQFHLSTAVILMFTTGGIMWANFVPFTLKAHFGDVPDKDVISSHYGWPWPFIKITNGKDSNGVLHNSFNVFTDWSGKNEILDLSVGLAILTVVWMISEGWIRFRERRRKSGVQ
ncbi:MAG: hypothetical protein WCT04_22680 [Planctomycetota bacterium]